MFLDLKSEHLLLPFTVGLVFPLVESIENSMEPRIVAGRRRRRKCGDFVFLGGSDRKVKRMRALEVYFFIDGGDDMRKRRTCCERRSHERIFLWFHGPTKAEIEKLLCSIHFHTIRDTSFLLLLEPIVELWVPCL